MTRLGWSQENLPRIVRRFELRPRATSARLESDPRGAAILGKGGLRVDGWVPAGRESDEPVHADRRIGGDQVYSGLAGVPHQLVLRVDGEAQSCRVPPFLLASGTDIDDPLGAVGWALEDQVQLVGELDGVAGRSLGTVPSDDDRDVGLDALGDVDRASHAGMRAREGRPTRREHPRDDFEVLAEDVQPLTDLRKAVAVGQPLVFLPARATA